IVLSLQGISKQFGTVQALSEVSLDCRAGEVHAVVGENGSGKSTLLGVASGFVAPDRGTVQIGGRALRKDSPAEARHLGLGMAYQENSQVLALSVKENLYLATPPKRRPPYSKMKTWARQMLPRFELDLFPDAPAFSLTLAQRQLLEVAKALIADPKVLLLDEPTTALGPDEVELLHRTILACAARGVGVVYVSHRLPEVLTVADRVTVLRDGKSQGTYQASGMSEPELVALMIGRPFGAAFPPHVATSGDKTNVLTITGLQGPSFGPISLAVGRGEILGIAGAEGNGQPEFFQCLSGRIPPKAGSVICAGDQLDLISPGEVVRAGILLLSGERRHESLFHVLGVRSNATIQVLKRFSRAGWVNRRLEHHAVARLVEHLKIRTPSLEQPVRFLSGGNQQKVALTRTFLRGSVNVILAYEPTQGVDVRARFDIYEALRAKAAEGTAVMVKSSDPIELSGFCDRVVVMSRGQIIDEIQKADLSEQRIIEAIVGGVGFGLRSRTPSRYDRPNDSLAPAAQRSGVSRSNREEASS
ncbi:MAG TPA: sugar ABC transporter ATP-binding protein, partial [Anaerolineae bacterium]